MHFICDNDNYLSKYTEITYYIGFSPFGVNILMKINPDKKISLRNLNWSYSITTSQNLLL